MHVMEATREQVAAAMIAVVAEHGEDHVSRMRSLWSPKHSAGCIQGEMLAKLGYPFDTDAATNGTARTVMQMLGFAEVPVDCPCGMAHANTQFADPDLYRALVMAQTANDSRLPWGVALKAFESELAAQGTGEYVISAARTPALTVEDDQLYWIDEMAQSPYSAGVTATAESVSTFASTIAQLVETMSALAAKAIPAYKPVSLTWNTESILPPVAQPKQIAFDKLAYYASTSWTMDAEFSEIVNVDTLKELVSS